MNTTFHFYIKSPTNRKLPVKFLKYNTNKENICINYGIGYLRIQIFPVLNYFRFDWKRRGPPRDEDLYCVTMSIACCTLI